MLYHDEIQNQRSERVLEPPSFLAGETPCVQKTPARGFCSNCLAMVLSNRAAVPQKQLLWGKLQFHGAKPLAMKEISERLCFPMSLACRNQAAICISFQKVCSTLWEVCQSSWKIMWSSRQNTMESLTSPVVRTISSNQRQPELPWQPHRRWRPWTSKGCRAQPQAKSI